MEKLVVVVRLVLLASLPVFATTPAAIKTRLESIIPRDTIVKLAYLKDARYSNFASHTKGSNVYVVSSEDGVVRKVNTVTGDLCMVSITADGKRVLFHNKTSSRTYVVDWDGRNEKLLFSSGFLLEYWRDRSNGTDWMLIDDGGTLRVNVDATTERIRVSRYNCGGLGGGLSDDGTRMVAFNGSWGSVAVATDVFTQGSGGCQGSMRAGPLNQWSCNESGHANAFVNNPAGTVAFKIAMGTRDSTGEGGRFTQHPDFFTYMSATRSTTCNPWNPVLHRVSDNKRIGIEQGIAPDKFVGDVDAVFLPSGGVSVERQPPKVLRPAAAVSDAGVFYSLSGRRIASSAAVHRASPGVVIARIGNGASALSRAVVLPR